MTNLLLRIGGYGIITSAEVETNTGADFSFSPVLCQFYSLAQKRPLLLMYG